MSILAGQNCFGIPGQEVSTLATINFCFKGKRNALHQARNMSFCHVIVPFYL